MSDRSDRTRRPEQDPTVDADATAAAHAAYAEAGAADADPAEASQPAPDAHDGAEQPGGAEPGAEGGAERPADAEDAEPEVLDLGTADAPEEAEEAEPDPVAAARAERDEYLDALRRERAEFENFRKRANRERAEALDRGVEQVCADLLLVLDNFGYTLQAAEGSSDEQLAKGVAMVHNQLVDVLEQAGLQQVPGQGATFDPAVHEAVDQVDAEEALGHAVDEPVVTEVLRPGYRFKDRLLRPASVRVAK